VPVFTDLDLSILYFPILIVSLIHPPEVEPVPQAHKFRSSSRLKTVCNIELRNRNLLLSLYI
jgi:hypothetical protein